MFWSTADMILRQIRSTDGTGTLSYLVADDETKKGVLIDPNIADTQEILLLAAKLGVTIEQVIDTHTHVDHVSGAGELKKAIGTVLLMHENTKDKWKVVDQGDAFGIGDILRANAALEVDRELRHGDTISVGSLQLTVLHTPGHTDNHISLLCEDALFTGDLLLIGQAGRSDLPGGNPEDQFDSIFNTILPLPEDTRIYPGHDYEEREYAFLGDEKRTNPFLKPRTKSEYVAFVADFFPPVADAVQDGKMTLQCGTKRVETSSTAFKNISPGELAATLEEDPSLYLLDVREPFELVAFGAIPGVTNIPTREVLLRREELPPTRSDRIAVICQSGNRSYEVAHLLAREGYVNIYNLQGGTSAWKREGHPTVRGIQATTPG
jgi:glyoxylase-like metal-dependent hydrolase (beta-lactamase superfamily II)/rhodanese-related sulfurtransferase